MGKNEDWGPPVSGFGGRETPGNIYTDREGNVVGTAEPASTALVPSNDDARPTFTAEELALIDPGGGDVDLTDDERAEYRSILARKVFTPEELAKHYNLTPAELEALQAPAPGKQSLDQQLAEIAALRRADPTKYWSEPVQQRERALIALREKLKAGPVQSEGSGIVPSDGAGIPASLREAWERQGGFEPNLRQAQATVQAMLDGMAPEEQAGFMEGFDALPEAATSAAYAYLATGGGSFGSAPDADIAEFVETPEGKELVTEWGSKAPRHVATIRARLGLMRQAMDAASWKAAEAWLDGLSASQAKAVWKALVR